MNALEIQSLSINCMELVMEGRHSEVMAIRAYGACVHANVRASRRTVDNFYAAIMPLTEPYCDVLASLSSHERAAVLQSIALRVYQNIQDVVMAACHE